MPLTDARLTAIMEMLPVCRVTADIGADHGRLGVQLILSGHSDEVWFSDISADSLFKARALVERFKLNNQARFFVGDGAKALPTAPDAAVIAGMGGVTISQIITEAQGKFDNAFLVLQPNVGTTELRKSLMDNGFAICDERVVRAAKRWYVLIAARKGAARYSEKELIVGPKLLKKRNEALRGYAAFRLRVAEKAMQGAARSANAPLTALQTEAEIWEEMCR